MRACCTLWSKHALKVSSGTSSAELFAAEAARAEAAEEAARRRGVHALATDQELNEAAARALRFAPPPRPPPPRAPVVQLGTVGYF